MNLRHSIHFGLHHTSVALLISAATSFLFNLTAYFKPEFISLVETSWKTRILWILSLCNLILFPCVHYYLTLVSEQNICCTSFCRELSENSKIIVCFSVWKIGDFLSHLTFAHGLRFRQITRITSYFVQPVVIGFSQHHQFITDSKWKVVSE